jgi:hypothetical protein
MPSCGGPSTAWAITFEGLRDLLHKFPEVNYGFAVFLNFLCVPLRLCERQVLAPSGQQCLEAMPKAGLSQRRKGNSKTKILRELLSVDSLRRLAI